MAQLLPETEATVFEDRTYVNPNTTVDETNAFIDNYRNLQQTNTDKIISDTHNLGTDVTSNLGGLTGSGSYWKNRYQTPQTSSAVADLRATAQAAALNTALENEKNAWAKKYNDAYRNYQQKSWNKSNSGNGGNTDPTNPTSNGEVETNTVSSSQFFGLEDVTVEETDDSYVFTDTNTGEKTTVSKEYMQQLYDDNGKLTDDGAVILDIRKMLGV